MFKDFTNEKVVSWTKECDICGLPGVFTQISYFPDCFKEIFEGLALAQKFKNFTNEEWCLGAENLV